MSRRARIWAYGSTGLVIVAGVVCAVALGGGLGEPLALALVGIGLVAITSLAFLEVGLSEDRARESEQRRLRERRRAARPPLQHPDPPGRRSAIGRMRGQRRKLR